MTDRFNTIAGWVLFAGIIALGSSIVAGEVFNSHRPETMGYPIPGVEAEGEGGAEAEQPIAVYLAAADVAKGEAVFKKCAACHTINAGGANGLGPNLHGVMGRAIAGTPGFAFSDALKGKGGNWDFASMDAWLASPKKFASGTKMSFAGLGSAAPGRFEPCIAGPRIGETGGDAARRGRTGARGSRTRGECAGRSVESAGGR